MLRDLGARNTRQIDPRLLERAGTPDQPKTAGEKPRPKD
jgi:hypothetical protein